MTMNNPLTEETVTWKVDDIEVEATLTRPAGAGPFPAVIFVAGSGPTDRNWNTPLIPGTNGSGALLARVLAERGYVTLRYDKRASGPHIVENVKQMVGKISMQGHLAELAGGVHLLAGEATVDPTRIFVLTNSEGCVHALNYQTQLANPPFAGMVLTSAFARPTGELAHSQIAAMLKDVPDGEALLTAYEKAVGDFVAGKPVTVDDNLPEGLRQIIQGITQPLNLPFTKELWIFNPLTLLRQVTVPVLIVLGKKDMQVDWQVDGSLFEQAAKEHRNISVAYCENASHVLKFEPKPRAQLTAAEAMATYSAEDTQLDPEAVDVITSWLQAHV